ncbi:hypothetical protein ACIGNX_18075 [Actinosynnema sp. NPDC053489]|uniref:hypothetical protein n=1 Tax=Actinosynnema sp. NPDC053489 TaxID=3363916 RepID=UPI0037CBB2E6
MEPRELHSMARRYLVERHDELTARYAELPNGGRARDGFRYRAEAKRLYPRYQVVQAVLEEVERLDPDRLPALDPLTDRLVEAAGSARSVFTSGWVGRVEAEVADEERRRFAAAVRAWRSGAGGPVGHMAYRRVLGPAESHEWRRRLASRWGVRNLSWHPMIADEVPDGVLVLREEAMWDGPGTDVVREALRGRGRVVELREHGAEHLLDLDLLDPVYTGAEGMWTDDALDWLAFASHEGTVAFGGVLADRLPRLWPDLDGWRWTGP